MRNTPNRYALYAAMPLKLNAICGWSHTSLAFAETSAPETLENCWIMLICSSDLVVRTAAGRYANTLHCQRPQGGLKAAGGGCGKGMPCYGIRRVTKSFITSSSSLLSVSTSWGIPHKVDRSIVLSSRVFSSIRRLSTSCVAPLLIVLGGGIRCHKELVERRREKRRKVRNLLLVKNYNY